MQSVLLLRCGDEMPPESNYPDWRKARGVRYICGVAIWYTLPLLERSSGALFFSRDAPRSETRPRARGRGALLLRPRFVGFSRMEEGGRAPLLLGEIL